MDAHFLNIWGNEDRQQHHIEKLVSKSNASVGLGYMSFLMSINRASITAEFREMVSDDFKDRFLAPLDSALRESIVRSRPSAQEYKCPLGAAVHVEQYIQ